MEYTRLSKIIRCCDVELSQLVRLLESLGIHVDMNSNSKISNAIVPLVVEKLSKNNRVDYPETSQIQFDWGAFQD